MARAPLIPGVPTQVVATRFPQPLIEALDRYTERVGTARSSVARLAVEEFLEREAPDLLNLPAAELVA